MPTLGFEPTISAGKRPQTYTLDRAVIGTNNFAVSSYTCLDLVQPLIATLDAQTHTLCYPNTSKQLKVEYHDFTDPCSYLLLSIKPKPKYLYFSSMAAILS